MPYYDLAAIRSKRPRGPDVAGRGERRRVLLAVLREATEPLISAEIARRMMARQGVVGGDQRFGRQFIKRAEMALARQEKQGTVRDVREGAGAGGGVGGQVLGGRLPSLTSACRLACALTCGLCWMERPRWPTIYGHIHCVSTCPPRNCAFCKGQLRIQCLCAARPAQPLA